MSNQSPPTTDEPTSSREAKADFKAAQAHQKAMRPWYKKKRFFILLGLAAMGAVVVMASAGGEAGTQVAAPDGQQQAEDSGDEGAELVGLNTPARDGNFEFTVTSFECGTEQVGDDFLTDDAQGQFCLLGVTVKNIGDDSQALFADNQLLVDDQEREFSADSMATVTHNPSGDAFFSEINPGNSIEGEIVFDVPEDASILTAELHDSAFSGGVIINLQ